ncbi:MAG: FecR domain-containing protein [Planctomycetota bacterium]|nr:FecR domain-containing protein [Planctomycetota bacterium]
MTPDFATQSTMDWLLPCLLDGTLSPDDEAKLWGLLEEDAQARAYYHDYIELHSILHSLHVVPDDLRAMAAFDYSEEPISKNDDRKPEKKSPILGFLGSFGQGGAGEGVNLTILTLCVVGFTTLVVGLTTISVLALVALWMPPQDQKVALESPSTAAGPAPREFVARLTQAMDCRWANSETAPKVGSFLLPRRTLQLEEGLAQITFESGVTLVLEAPAVFAPKSNYGGTLQLGRLTVEVPASGIGFAIETPSVRIVDLGTEFGVQVDQEQGVEVHVLKGQVASAWTAQQEGEQKVVRLSQNDSATFDTRNKTVQRGTAKADQFVRRMPPAPRVRFFTDQAAWSAAAGRAETFSTHGRNLTQAAEVSAVPQAGQTLAAVLNFPSSATRLARGFRISMLEPGSGKGHGFVFDDYNKPGDSPGFDNALSVGKIERFQDDDWQMEITSGPRLYAFAFDLCDNAPAKGESISVYGTGNRLLARYDEIPGVGQQHVFLGMISNTPITKIVFNEDPADDDTAIANFRFATAPRQQ